MHAPLLTMTGMTKRFPGVLALNNAKLEVRPGEVHCLLGENGAGKSTLMNILAGSLRPDSGEMRLDNHPYRPESPRHAQMLGVSIIHQEMNLFPGMTVAENIMLGNEPRRGRWPILDHKRTKQRAAGLLTQIGSSLDVSRPVHTCSIAQQQVIEIAKALSFDSRILVMDEPSTALTQHEVVALFRLIRKLTEDGVGVIYISHRLEEVQRIGDRATIMRDGEHVLTKPMNELDRNSIIKAMVGRSLEEEFPKRITQRGSCRLKVDNLSRRGAFKNVSFKLYEGEVLGITGLVGAGRTELARALFGADAADAGSIVINGQEVKIRSPQQAIAHGIGLLPEDRKAQGFVPELSIRENITLANFPYFSKKGRVDRKLELATTGKYINRLNIRTPSSEQSVVNLSGGNQQKVVLAKWLATQCSCLIFDEPTRGVDVGAKTEIYALMNDLVDAGTAILMISSDLPEILGMSDRILVMRGGELVGELSKGQASQEAVMQLATGA